MLQRHYVPVIMEHGVKYENGVDKELSICTLMFIWVYVGLHFCCEAVIYLFIYTIVQTEVLITQNVNLLYQLRQ